MFYTAKKARITSIVCTTLLISAQLFAPISAIVPKAGASASDDHKVVICHRTASYSNPYVQITVDQSAADGIAGNSGKEADHYGEHQGPVFYPTIPKHTEWGDIIPPIDGVHSGWNWTAEGHDIWSHDCNIPDSGSVTVNKCVDEIGNNQYICDNELANTLGFQWGFDDATAPSWNDMGATVGGVATGDQSIVENQVSGYSFTGWYKTDDEHHSCTNPEKATHQPVAVNVKKNKTTEITLCNQADPNGSITLIKSVTNNNGGTAGSDAFGLTIGNTSVKSGQKLTLPAGSYAINEAGLPGYNFVSITSGNCPEQRGGTVTLKAGQNIVCTITNDDAAPSLTLVKKVDNQHGGTAQASDWTLSATGPTTISGAGGVTSDSTFKAGTYTLSESNGPSGYQAGAWTCDNGVSVAEGKITLVNGQATICTVTNSDTPASLTIVKYASPASTRSFSFTSGKLGDFSLTGDNGNGSSKMFDGLSSGTYSLSELASDNWKIDSMWCDNENYDTSSTTLWVSLQNGDHVTCYVQNVELNTISGHKFNDVNNNHVWDDGEPTLKGWTITLSKGCDERAAFVLGLMTNGQNDCTGSVNLTTTTDADGAYQFSGLEPGTYTVCEVQQDKWEQTYPQTANGCHEITIEGPGEVATADFGNHPIPQVLGSETTTPHTLAVTGANASVNLMVGLTLLGMVAVLHFASRRQHG